MRQSFNLEWQLTFVWLGSTIHLPTKNAELPTNKCMRTHHGAFKASFGLSLDCLCTVSMSLNCLWTVFGLSQCLWNVLTVSLFCFWRALEYAVFLMLSFAHRLLPTCVSFMLEEAVPLNRIETVVVAIAIVVVVAILVTHETVIQL